MSYYYLAFGIPIVSEIELPALVPVENGKGFLNPVYVKLGIIPQDLKTPGTHPDRFAYCNANEMIYIIDNIIKFYISNGNEIIIEPISPNYMGNLIYFYSNCLAAILYQRDIVPFHVSGVFVEKDKVALFAAPSRTGKSTLALKLLELGYQPFTDDTAVLFFKNGKCYAQASYPMMRLWQNTIDSQSHLKEDDKQRLYDDDDDYEKFGFSFHQQFSLEPCEVKQIIFLKKYGGELTERPVKNIDAFKALADNVYRCHWIPAMGRNKLQFVLISQILNTVPHTEAIRPENGESFESFPLLIKNILQKSIL